MVFTIEPILVAGKRDIFTWPDEWTAASSDGSWYDELFISLYMFSILTIRYFFYGLRTGRRRSSTKC